MPEPHLRAADADRAAVATQLGEQMSAGRLTVAEYDERLARAYAARTYGELEALTADLPRPAGAVARHQHHGDVRRRRRRARLLPALVARPQLRLLGCGQPLHVGVVPGRGGDLHGEHRSTVLTRSTWNR